MIEIYARPPQKGKDNTLKTHLEKVANLCVNIFKSFNLNLPDSLPKGFLADFLYILGITHDFGKATSYFQNYITADDTEKKTLKNKPETHHGTFSALFTFWLVLELIKQKYPELEGNGWEFYGFFIVKKHHGNLDNLAISNTTTPEIDKIEFDVIKRQLKALNKDFISQMIASLSKSKKFNIYENPPFYDDLLDFYEEILSEPAIDFFLDKDECEEIIDYIFFQLCYSILLQSDKQHSIFGKDQLFRREDLAKSDIVSQYKQNRFGSPKTELDVLRQNIAEEVVENIQNFDFSKRILTLNAPTGSGKTLTALEAAMKLREKITSQQGVATPCYRIIYCLPFTSIIDQNYDVFTEVLDNPDTDILLKHHHLADLTYSFKEDDVNYPEKKDPVFLIEGWESEVIVTTFVQLFHTLCTNRNRLIRKFHKLANSIIILDEVQTIPHKFWLFTREILSEIADKLNSYIILMTATQPAIFGEKEVYELLKNKKQYFEKMSRINLSYTSDPISFEEYKKKAKDAIQQADESFLFVMNTVNSSIELFKELFDKADSKREYFYLSTNITPKERLERIKKIKEKTEKQKIVVSTQLVEAGVDIDMDNVWRDFAPMDSINQVSGRCNRNDSEKKGKVKVFRIENQNGKEFSSFIYGKEGLGIVKTADILKDRPQLSESEFLTIIDLYYQNLKKSMLNDTSDEILNSITEMRFEDIGKFSLIDYYPTCDIFIELDEEAQKVWREYCRFKTKMREGNVDLSDMMIKRKTLSRKLSPYIISVPDKYVPEKDKNEREKSVIIHIPLDGVSLVYDKKIGWIREDTRKGWVL